MGEMYRKSETGKIYVGGRMRDGTIGANFYLGADKRVQLFPVSRVSKGKKKVARKFIGFVHETSDSLGSSQKIAVDQADLRKHPRDSLIKSCGERDKKSLEWKQFEVSEPSFQQWKKSSSFCSFFGIMS